MAVNQPGQSLFSTLEESARAHSRDLARALYLFASHLHKTLFPGTRRAVASLQRILEICSQLKAFDQDGKDFKLTFPLCVGLLKKSQEEGGAIAEWNATRKAVTEVAGEDLGFLQYFSKYPVHVYRIVSNTNNKTHVPASQQLIAQYGFAPSDILCHGFPDIYIRPDEAAKRTMTPRYFLALDHAARAIVVCIRGTYSLQDAITDLLCHEEPFLGGLAHSGMVHAMLQVEVEVRDPLLRAVRAFPEYRLVVTGHSMGGGTAVLLTLHLLMEPAWTNKLHGVEVKCVALAPPPVFVRSQPLPDNVKKSIWILINNGDFVCRTSMATLAQLTLEMRQIDDLVLNGYEAIRILNKGDEKMVKLINQRLAPIMQDRFVFFAHPGTCYRMHLNEEEDLVMQEVESEEMHRRLVLFDSMFSDHGALTYAELLKPKPATVGDQFRRMSVLEEEPDDEHLFA